MSDQKTCGTCIHYRPHRNPVTGRIRPAVPGDCGWPKPEVWPMVYSMHVRSVWPHTAADRCGCYERKETMMAEENYTENGEITFDPTTKEYTVWDECYCNKVCVTNYPKVAEVALAAYAENYL